MDYKSLLYIHYKYSFLSEGTFVKESEKETEINTFADLQILENENWWKTPFTKVRS